MQDDFFVAAGAIAINLLCADEHMAAGANCCAAHSGADALGALVPPRAAHPRSLPSEALALLAEMPRASNRPHAC